MKSKKNEKTRSNIKTVKIILRVVFAVLFFIVGFNFSKTTFFVTLPFFGYHTFIELLVSSAAGLFGFFVFPTLLFKLKVWIEELIISTVTMIVTNFWDQQSKRIQDARREKQKRRSEEKSLIEKREMENAVILDTSVLVDGRILDVVKTGFFDRPLVITQNVVEELQKIADSKNKIKRNRGRRGLDVVKDLKKMTRVLMPELKTSEKEVDKQLINYAKEKKQKLVTLDFNLNKVAKLSGIKVLNLNDLINSLKTVLLPGEDLKVRVSHAGKEKSQGIGYLGDGTMIIVDKASGNVGEEVDAVVAKVIQSSAGRIIFTTLKSSDK